VLGYDSALRLARIWTMLTSTQTPTTHWGLGNRDGRDVIYAPPLVISSSCRCTAWTHVDFRRSLYSVRDCGTLCL